MQIMSSSKVATTSLKLKFAALIGLGLAVSLLAATVSRAQADDAELRAIIEKAVAAHGGAEKLGQFKAVSSKWVGKHKVENMFYWDAVRTVTYEMPDKIRLDYEVTNPNGNKFSFSRVVSGKKGWQGSNRGTRDLPATDVTHITEEFYAHSLASLAPFTVKDAFDKDKGFVLSPFGNVTVDGKEAVGVGVACKGRPDVNLFFDKKTGLVIKSERRTKDPRTEEEYTAESIYRDHKEFQGVMWPTTRIDRRDNRDLDENSGRFELSEFQARERVEEATLARP
jgi:hypothetical protein